MSRLPSVSPVLHLYMLFLQSPPLPCYHVHGVRQVLYEALHCLNTAMAPVAMHTAQDVWQHALPIVQRGAGWPASSLADGMPVLGM